MQHLTLFTEDPDGEYPSQEVVWEKFEKVFIAAAGLITHAPVLRDYFYRGLEELLQDNVMYLELRSGLSKVRALVCVCFVPDSPLLSAAMLDPLFICVFQTYELDGTVHDTAWTLRTFQEVTRKFVSDHPDFLGARVIFSVHRY